MVRRVPPDRVEEAVDVLADAFHDYPVMRYILGDSGAEYDRRLLALCGMFVFGRAFRGDPILMVEDEGRAVAVATITPPGDPDPPPEVIERREALWRELGPGPRERFETLVDVWTAFALAEPQYHLNMLGVRRSHMGRGFARPLLDAVHEMSRRDPVSTGVSLTTEDPKNVALYQHFGYRIVGHAKVDDALETWGFFRDEPPRGSGE